MTYTLTLPTKSEKYKWLQLNLELEPYITQCKNLIVDFKNVTFVEPDHIVVLACYLEIFHSNHCDIKFINVRSDVNDYLIRINYRQYFDCNSEKPKFTDIKSTTTIPLWNIQQEEITSYSLFAKNFFTNNFFKTSDLLILQANLEEVFNNIFDHANSPVNGFVTSQYFPKTNIITCSICDIGTGIAAKVNEDRMKKGEEQLLDSQALIKATQKGYSTKSIPQNKGLGLDNILDIPRNKQGSVTIISNKGYFINNGQEEIAKELNYSFHGTFIRISIDTSKLDELDSEEYEFEF